MQNINNITIRSYFFITVILLLSYTSYGQNTLSAKTYHTHHQSCYFLGTVEYDYLLQLKEDSTVSYIVYSTSYKTEYKIVTKEIYTGSYSIANNKLEVLLTTYNTFHSKKGDSSATSSVHSFKPNIINRKLLFVLGANDLVPIDTYIPLLMKASPLKSDWLSAKFDLWGKKSSSDVEIFGKSN